jgi:formate-dependent nitrite reductase cytochrome c552 subunit
VELLRYEDIAERKFSQWSMALVKLSVDDPMVKVQHPEFDPYSASGDQVMHLLANLIQTAQPITAPTP